MNKDPLEDSYLDEDEFFSNKREVKKLKKIKSKKDRSKFKLSNLNKETLAIKPQNALPMGRVIRLSAGGYHVFWEGEEWLCTLKGKLKKEKKLYKNLIVIGDWVYFEKSLDNEGVIVQAHPRKSVFSRSDNLNQRQEQLLASNVDQVLITCSVMDPLLQPFLIDRYLISAKKGGIEPVILINKLDLLCSPNYPKEEREAQKNLLEEVIDIYQKLGILLYTLDKTTPSYTSTLEKVMQGKTSVFSGKSGVGKTSLINFITHLNMKVNKTVRRTKKGSHTTSNSSLIPLEGGGFCIDTPGIKSFGIWDLKAEELQDYFIDIAKAAKNCKFQNCWHIHEPECGVKKALEEKSLSKLRYDSYRQILKTLQEKHLRR